MLLWSLCEFRLVNLSPALKIMEKDEEIRKRFKQCFELEVEATRANINEDEYKRLWAGAAGVSGGKVRKSEDSSYPICIEIP